RRLLNSQSDDLGLFDAIGETFKGKRRQVVIWVWVVSFIIAAFFVFCVIQFFNSTDTDQKLLWLGGFLTALIAQGNIKLWYFMEMNRAALARDVKRVELQLSILANK
ncbi:MAG: hypothetical protein COA42_17195, partial [Alteromonadaceae bacterium]